MPQQAVNLALPSSASPPSRCHPMYSLRRLLIIIASLGSVFFLFSDDRFAHYFLFGCIIFAMYDLLAYAQSPDDNPRWPQKRFLFGDLAFAFLLQYSYWASMIAFDYRYRYYAYATEAWALLATGICSIIHAYCFWKQLVVWYKQRCQVALSKEPCQRCGYVERGQEETGRNNQSSGHASPFQTSPKPGRPCSHSDEAYTQATGRQKPVGRVQCATSSAGANSESLLTPTSQESAMEEGLLVGSVSDYDLGAMSEPVIQAKETVVSQGRKKKRTIGANILPHLAK